MLMLVIWRLFVCIAFIQISHTQDGPATGLTCDAIEKDNTCIIESNGEIAICKGGSCATNNSSNISVLVLCSRREKDFNPHFLSEYPNLKNFTLFRSSVEEFADDFVEIPRLKILNLTHNNITYLRQSTFRKLESLVILDLRFNKLRHFNPEIVSNLRSMEIIFLYGNHWDCDRNFLWIVEKSSIRTLVADADQLVCKFAFKDKPIIAIMQMIQTLESECQEISDHCICSLDHVIRVQGNTLRPMIIVECVYKRLQALPAKLPSFTSTLNMTGNEITDLSPLRNNEKYLSLLNVYLDYNNISSISILEDSPFLFTFQALSLRGNKLTEVPVYALEQAFEKNPNIGKVTLGQNPWICDCGFTPVFRDFLAKYRKVIVDIDNVTCSYRPNDDKSLLPVSNLLYIHYEQPALSSNVNTLKMKPKLFPMASRPAKILSLSRNKLCHQFKISALNVLNVCMTVLLAIVLLDFGYNYYMYKRYSKLPWIANRLP